jgi:hypothetical protein
MIRCTSFEAESTWAPRGCANVLLSQKTSVTGPPPRIDAHVKMLMSAAANAPVESNRLSATTILSLD